MDQLFDSLFPSLLDQECHRGIRETYSWLKIPNMLNLRCILFTLNILLKFQNLSFK